MSIDPNTIVLPRIETLHEDIHIVELGYMLVDMWKHENALFNKYGSYDEEHFQSRLDTIHDAVSSIVKLIIQAVATTFDGLFVKFLAYVWARGDDETTWSVFSEQKTTDYQIVASIMQDIKAQSILYRTVEHERVAA